MKIDFNLVEEKANPNFNGGEGIFNAKILNDGLNKILKGRLSKGSTIGLHTHTDSSEIIYVLEGTGIMTTDGVEEVLKPGDVSYCPIGHNHTFRNDFDEELVFFAIVPKQSK